MVIITVVVVVMTVDCHRHDCCVVNIVVCTSKAGLIATDAVDRAVAAAQAEATRRAVDAAVVQVRIPVLTFACTLLRRTEPPSTKVPSTKWLLVPMSLRIMVTITR